MEELLETRKLPSVAASAQTNPGEADPPEDTVFGDSFTFADRSEHHIETLEEASSLLMLDELKAITKEAKVQGKGKIKEN